MVGGDVFVPTDAMKRFLACFNPIAVAKVCKASCVGITWLSSSTVLYHCEVASETVCHDAKKLNVTI